MTNVTVNRIKTDERQSVQDEIDQFFAKGGKITNLDQRERAPEKEFGRSRDMAKSKYNCFHIGNG